MKVYVDHDLCIGCSLCAGIEPNVFQMNDDNLAEVIAETTPQTENTVAEAIDSCPVSAISQE